MGPTATGKSALALALAREFDVEIVSVDSAQVYRGMDIGTAKPDAATRARVPHHLIDVIDPTEAYSAARFRADALAAMAAIRARGRVPLLVGGTMLYFKALTEGLSALPPADPAMRAALDARAAARGWPALHAELARVDPATAARLAPNDAQRIQRALEVLRADRPAAVGAAGRADGRPRAGPALALALLPSDRAALHDAIARASTRCWRGARRRAARAAGRATRCTPDLPSMRCVGYRQAWRVPRRRASTRAALRENGIAATRQLAKRQLTWLRATPATRSTRRCRSARDALAADRRGALRRGAGAALRCQQESGSNLRRVFAASRAARPCRAPRSTTNCGTATSSAPRPTARRCSTSTATSCTR